MKSTPSSGIPRDNFWLPARMTWLSRSGPWSKTAAFTTCRLIPRRYTRSNGRPPGPALRIPTWIWSWPALLLTRPCVCGMWSVALAFTPWPSTLSPFILSLSARTANSWLPAVLISASTFGAHRPDNWSTATVELAVFLKSAGTREEARLELVLRMAAFLFWTFESCRTFKDYVVLQIKNRIIINLIMKVDLRFRDTLI